MLNKLKNSYFYKSLFAAKKNIKNTFFIIIFDVLFLLSIFSVSKFTELIAPSLGNLSQSISGMVFFILAIVYYLALILLYSFFKYILLDLIKYFLKKTEFSFNRLGSFFLLNMIIFIMLFIVFLLFNFILLSIRQEFAPFVFIIMILPYLYFSYPLLNISHALFLEEYSISDILKNAFKGIFLKVRPFLGIYSFSIILFILYLIVFYLFGILLNIIFSKNYNILIGYYGLYQNIFFILTGIVLYVIHFINRVGFYLIVKEKFLKNIRMH